MDRAAALRDAITQNLKSRKWREGHRLPTERELSDQYGLSRSTVRRVLSDLKQQRLITQRVGSGTYVSSDAGEVLAVFTNDNPGLSTSPAELMAARLVLEPSIIEMIVGNAIAADFARMEACCDNAEAAATLEDFEQQDGMLHAAIADAAHNAFISSVFRLMNQVRAEGEWGVLKRRSTTEARRLEYQRDHRALVAALKDRDAPRARALCLEHLKRVRRHLLGV